MIRFIAIPLGIMALLFGIMFMVAGIVSNTWWQLLLGGGLVGASYGWAWREDE